MTIQQTASVEPNEQYRINAWADTCYKLVVEPSKKKSLVNHIFAELAPLIAREDWEACDARLATLDYARLDAQACVALLVATQSHTARSHLKHWDTMKDQCQAVFKREDYALHLFSALWTTVPNNRGVR